MRFKLLANYIVAIVTLGSFVFMAYAENELTKLESTEQVETIKKKSNCQLAKL